MKILIWGLGERTKNYIRRRFFSKCQIIGFIDVKPESDEYEGIKVYSLDNMNEIMEYADYIVICNQIYNGAIEICFDLGISKDKIVFTEGLEEMFFNQDTETISNISPMLAEEIKLHRFSLIGLNEKDIFDSESDIGKGKFAQPRYKKDYFRYRTFEFVANEIEAQNLPGDIAEFGVFRGSFAALINKKFPNRKMFLFDTFYGFDQDELKNEIELGRTDAEFGRFYAETSEDIVRQVLTYPEQVVFLKGLFPQSVNDQAANTKYCFVSIDVDFEKSIYQGLLFFYPRMCEGGYIFVHDYNSHNLVGVKNAVDRFEKEQHIKLKKVPLADRSGTLVIVK